MAADGLDKAIREVSDLPVSRRRIRILKLAARLLRHFHEPEVIDFRPRQLDLFDWVPRWNWKPEKGE